MANPIDFHERLNRLWNFPTMVFKNVLGKILDCDGIEGPLRFTPDDGCNFLQGHVADLFKCEVKVPFLENGPQVATDKCVSDATTGEDGETSVRWSSWVRGRRQDGLPLPALGKQPASTLLHEVLVELSHCRPVLSSFLFELLGPGLLLKCLTALEFFFPEAAHVKPIELFSPPMTNVFWMLLHRFSKPIFL